MKTSLIAVVCALAIGTAGQASGNQVVDGTLGPGALYRMVRPTVWNGSLLLYAHGYVGATQPVALPAEADLLVTQLTAQGFAVAYSSFSENGWAVKDGAQRTHQLLGTFSDRFGVPARVYLVGTSMGGLIAIKLQEQYPWKFDGVVTVCSAGDTRQLFDYYAHARALFDVLYPGRLPGDAGSVPPAVNVQAQIVAPAAAAMAASPAGATTLAAIDQTPIPFSNPVELVTSIVTALGAHASSFTDLVPKLHGKAYFGNQDVEYSSALLPPPTIGLINTVVDRFDASPAALNYMEHSYEPSGRLTVPMIMLAMSRDPLVPGFNRASYAARVTAAGRPDLLVQRTIIGYGHCPVPPQEVARAIGELVVWVELGVKPQP